MFCEIHSSNLPTNQVHEDIIDFQTLAEIQHEQETENYFGKSTDISLTTDNPESVNKIAEEELLYYKEIDDDLESDFFFTRHHKPLNSLKDLLQSEGFHDPIKTSVTISRSELLYMILKLNTSNHLSLTILSSILSLVNSMFEEPILPASKYMVDKIFNHNDDVDFHITCPKCSKYLGNLNELTPNTSCENCQCGIDEINHSSSNFFTMINPSKSIKNLLETYEDHFDKVMKGDFSNNSNICDIYDGERYREFVSKLPSESQSRYVSLTFNSDGAAPFKSSPLSVWPIFTMINEIPLQNRTNNLITCALWFNKSKPDMKVFLKFFVEMINKLSEEGIDCTIKGNLINIKVYCILCCVDTVARSPMQGLVQFNGKYGCNWCLHPTEYSGASRYPYDENAPPPPLRTAEQTIQYMGRVHSQKNPIFGVKKVSPLINIEHFDIIRGFVPDYMHCILCGAEKQITEYMLKNNGDFYGDLVEQIKFPYQVGRLTRTFSHRKYWKCKEWENWILYANLIVFEFKLDEKKMDYWSLHVESLHILLHHSIKPEELDLAERKLYEFVQRTQKNYTIKSMTYNVHQLLHVCQSVRDCGPIYAHSAFAFEAGNHDLLQAIHCGKGVISQILRHLNISESMKVLEKHVFENSSLIVQEYCAKTFSTRIKKSLKLSDVTYFGISSPVKKFFFLVNMQNAMNNVAYSSVETNDVVEINSAELEDEAEVYTADDMRYLELNLVGNTG
uniref:Transposase domain-containing protein n=1 Tax=Trichogramma kaykai TaxID=54128 RepID=A0ABD2WYF1_9HYME